VPEGGRNQALWDEACRLHNRSTDKDAGLEALLAYNAERCDPPLSDEDVRGVCDRVWSQDRRFENTDYGNAERFVDEHRDDVRFVHEFNRWYVWDGHHWREDTRREVELLCKQTIRKMQLKAVLLDDDNRKRALIKWALASESVGRIAAAIQLARSEPGITITAADLDKDPWALVTTNAVLDLRTGKPVAARRDALLTKQAGTSYDPGATCPVWDAYLDRVMRGDKARINFLQRAVGYALTGLTTEHCVFFLYGTGANGKTTFVNTIHAMLGEYARATDTNMWVSKKHASVPDDLAALRGIRLATTTEGEDGQRLAESRIKQIAGGDVIAARKLYGDWFQFVPQLKLFFATNHKPVIMSDDHAIWRRIRLIPFEVQIPEAERDQTLQRKLLAELPGILNWALEGCLQWQAEGLQPPAAVQEAGKQYRAEQDRIGAFLDECCVVNPDQTTMTVTASALYGSYTRWCNNNGCHSLSALRFKEKLGERGLVQHKTKKANEWRGIGLLSLQQSDPPGEADPDGMDYPM
jgi:putative DNA primase/helicase